MSISVSRVLQQKFSSARKGKSLLVRLMKKYRDENLKSMVFIVFPEHDEEINRIGLLYLDEFLLRNDFKKAMLIASDSKFSDKSKLVSSNIVEEIILTEEEVSNLICYYSMNFALKNLFVVSLDKPLGRRGTNLLGKNGLSLEQMIAIGVYKILPFEKIKPSSGVQK